MADSAFEWASGRGLVRVNPVHGEQEAKLVLGDSFCFKEETGVSRTEHVRMEIEEFCRQFRFHNGSFCLVILEGKHHTCK